MALLSRDKEDTTKISETLLKRVDRGRQRKNDLAPENNEIMQFARGNQYVFRSPKGGLLHQDTVTNLLNGTGKPPHRMRTVRNMIVDVVATEVSAATQRVPSYEVAPSKTDADVQAAAKLGERVALYGYDKWRLRDVTVRAVTYATLCGEGFAWPFFDNSIGPFIRDGDKNVVGLGDVRIRVMGPNEVFWEPGQRFEDSRWHCVEQARSIESVEAMEKFQGKELKADATTESSTSGPGKASTTNLVMVTDYLERPSLDNPKGRWVTMANKRKIVPDRPYPCTDNKKRPLDEPVIHKLSYFVDPDNDRDHGLGRHLLDPQRTINDCVNKLLEWKNIALNPQLFVSPGLLKRQRLTDEPGAVWEIPQPNENIRWRDTPQVPGELFQMLEQAEGDIARIAAQNDIPRGVESARGIQALIEKDSARRAAFVSGLAEFHSRLMRHCLYLVQRHYTEGRLLKLQGRFGPELIKGFQGADLMGQADVRVPPGSIEPRTKAAIEAKILSYADRGWVKPEAAMAAINGGTAEKLVESYELDVGRANRIIRKIMEGPKMLLTDDDQAKQAAYEQQMQGYQQMLAQSPPMPGVQPPPPPELPKPAWMPRHFDNVDVHKAIFEDWMKTVDYEESDPGMKEAADLYYEGLDAIAAEKAMKAAQQQMQMAQGLGLQNAAKPQSKGMPDMPGAGGPEAPPTQNQPPDQRGFQ